MKKVLLTVPVFVAIFVVVRLLAPAQSTAERIEFLVWEALACVGPLVAASCFDRGDHLRAAWLLFGVSYACLFVGGAARFAQGKGPSWVRVVAIVLSNVASSAGAVLFARTSSVAGLALPGSTVSRSGARLAALGVAVALGGPPIVVGVRKLIALHALPNGLVPIFASGGDLISFAMIAPILLTALALRGGLIAWPWSLLTAAELSWLLFDVQSSFVRGRARWLDIVVSSFRVAAFAFTFAAGLAQRKLSRGQ